MVSEFANEALTDFTNADHRQAMQAALRSVQDEFSREWPLVIGGAQVTSGAWIQSHNERARLLTRSGDCQRHGVRPDGRRLLERPTPS